MKVELDQRGNPYLETMNTTHLPDDRKHSKAQRNSQRPALAVGKDLPFYRPRFTDRSKR